MKLGGYHKGSRGFGSSGSGRPSAGFTIVETLVVLAVTGGLFVAIAATMTGRQARTQFTTAINNAQQQLQQVINETATGYYPNGGDFHCDSTGSPVKLTTTTHNEQGTNGGCLFLGKVVQVGLGSGNAASQFGVLPLVGNQYAPSTFNPVLTVNAAKPRALYPDGASEPRVPTSAGTVINLQSGLLPVAVSYVHGGSTVSAGAVAFVAGDSSGTITSLDGTGLKSGSQQLSLYGVRTSVINTSGGLQAASRSVGNTTSNSATGNLESAASATICLASGTTQQSGLITISAGLQVTLAIKDGQAC